MTYTRRTPPAKYSLSLARICFDVLLGERTSTSMSKWVRKSLLTLGFSLGNFMSEGNHERSCFESQTTVSPATAVETYSRCVLVPSNPGDPGIGQRQTPGPNCPVVGSKPANDL